MLNMQEQAAFPALADAEFMLLTTFRQAGKPVPTPVWFAQLGDRLYVTTLGQAGKAKRLRANGRAWVAPCTAIGQILGPGHAAQGRVLPPAAFPAGQASQRNARRPAVVPANASRPLVSLVEAAALPRSRPAAGGDHDDYCHRAGDHCRAPRRRA